jgi:RNA polymerase sigma factor (sigma-70 family)
MYAEAQKVLHPRARPQPRTPRRADEEERALVGGESADDVLQDALLALLSYNPNKLETTWEGLAVTIARNKAKDALRRATKGRRTATSGDEDDVTVVSLADDQVAREADRATGTTVEEEFIRTQQQIVLIGLARRLLDERERRIFFDVHHGGVSCAEVGRHLGLTGARVGQIYRQVSERLLDAARNDPSFPTDLPERRTR